MLAMIIATAAVYQKVERGYRGGKKGREARREKEGMEGEEGERKGGRQEGRGEKILNI